MLPLKNKTILITRSAFQAEGFITQLKNLGAKALTLPLIETTCINQDDLINKVSHSNYDWVIFTSANAVRSFFKTVSPEKVSSKIAVVGSKTAQALKEYTVKPDFTPSEYTAKVLAEEMPVSAGERLLIPRSDLAKNEIVEILTAKDCIVDLISIYSNKSVVYSQTELDTIFNQKIDFITFTSGSTVSSFMNLGIQLNDEKIICIGPETAKIAKNNKLPISAIANPHTIEGMIKSINSFK